MVAGGSVQRTQKNFPREAIAERTEGGRPLRWVSIP